MSTSVTLPALGESVTEGTVSRWLKQVGDTVEADEPLRLLMVALLGEGHALVEDVPGVGKTLLTRAFARALGLGFGRIQGTPDLLPTDITGSSILDNGSFRFIAGPVFTNVLLVDEINRATPRTQAALLEAMQERQVSVEGETRPLPTPFLVLATQNPVELEGTFALPEAQLDRFLVRVTLGYPSEAGELAIAERFQASAEPLELVERVADEELLVELRDAARTVVVSDRVRGYLVSLVRATRGHPDLRLGASPRTSGALYRAAQRSSRFSAPQLARALARTAEVDVKLKDSAPVLETFTAYVGDLIAGN